MSKGEFLNQLRKKLHSLPKNDLERIIDFYEEMINDMVEDGFTEEEAIQKVGNIDEIVKDIQLNLPITTLIENKIKESHNRSNNRLLWFLIVILTFPIWFSVAAAVLSALFAIAVSIFMVIGGILFAIAAVCISIIVAFAVGIYYSFKESIWYGLFFVGFSMGLSGLLIISIKLFKELFILARSSTFKFIKFIKSLLISKEN